MFIQKIHLKNIKSYSEQIFEFKKGINFIHGQNGAGKSTIIEAIGFCLFNETLGSLGYSYETFVNQNAKSGFIKIWFQGNDQRNYCITRQIRKTAQKAWFLEDLETGDLWEKKEEIEHIFKKIMLLKNTDNISHIFWDIIAVNQGQFTTPFLLPEGKRTETFNQIFNLEEYRVAYDKSSKLENILKEKIVQQEYLIKDLTNFTFNLNQLKKELADNKKNIKKQELILKKLTKEEIELDNHYQKVKEKKNNQEQLSQKITLWKQKIIYQNNSLQKLDQEITISQQAQKICQANETAFNNYNKTAIQIEQQETVIKNLEKIEHKFNNLQEKISNLKTKITERNTFIAKQETNFLKQKEQLKLEEEKNITLLANYQKEQKQWQTKQITINALTKTSLHFNKLIEQYFHQKETKLQKKITQTESKLQELSFNKEKIKDGICFVCGTKNDNFDHNFEQEITRYQQVLSTQKNELNLLINKFSSPIKASFFEDIINNLQELKNDLELDLNNWQNNTNLKFFKDKSLLLEQKINAWQNGIKNKNDNLLQEITKKSTLLNKIIEHKKDIKTQEKELITQKELISNFIKEKESKEKELIILTTQLKQLHLEKNKIKILKEDQKKSQPGFNFYQTNLVSAQKITALILEKKTNEEQLESIINQNKWLEKQLIILLTELAQLIGKKQITDLNILTTILTNLETKQTNLKEKLGSLKNFLLERDKEQKKLLEQIEKWKKNLVKIEEIKQTQQKIIKKQHLLNFIRNEVLKKTPGPLAERYRQHISLWANKIYRQISSHNETLNWGKNFDIQLTNNLYYRNFKQLSGGEQISTAFAIRLSLIHSFSNMGIWFFDEPTVNLDTQRRGNLAKIIPKIASDFEQLFIISHDDSFDSITDQVIEISKSWDL